MNYCDVDELVANDCEMKDVELLSNLINLKYLDLS